MARVLVLVLVLILGLSGVTYAERVPVVLVHGLGSEPDTWEPLIRELGAVGYERDIDMFVFDYSRAEHNDFVWLADNEFNIFVEEVLMHTGAEEIDIVSHSMGGLIARRYADSSGGVRNLFLIAVPNRGSFLADLWYVTQEKTEQETLRRENGVYRNIKEVDLSAGTGVRSFSEYVAERSFGLHEPLYHRFIVGDIFFVSPKERGEARQYEEWLEVNYSEELYAGEYLLSDVYSDSSGSGLTPLYYEKVAIDTAKYLYRQLLSPFEVLVDGWEKDIVKGPTIKETIIFTAKERVLSITIGIGERWFQGTSLKTSLNWGLDWLGLSSTIGLERLVSETFSFYDAGEEKLANFTLAELNSGGGATRHISILGESPNVWSFVGNIGSNDLAVEHESSWLPLNYNDSFKLFSRFFATNHSWILNDKRVLGYIVSELQWPQTTVMSESEKELAVKHSEARYLQIDKSLFSDDRDLRVVTEEGVLLWVMVYLDGWQVVAEGEGDLLVSSEWLQYEQWLVGLRISGDDLDILRENQSQVISVFLEQGNYVPVNEEEPEVINVIRRSKLTTTKKESEWAHSYWVWDFGDGEREIVFSDAAEISQGYRFSKVGSYEVTAVSYTEDEREIVRFNWQIDVSEDEVGTEFVFDGYTALPPHVELRLEGPENWVTGLPAEYMVIAEVGDPPFGEVVEISYHPGETFIVVWERPGEFQVQGGITVKVSYVLGERKRTYFHTYVVEENVAVYATSQE